MPSHSAHLEISHAIPEDADSARKVGQILVALQALPSDTPTFFFRRPAIC
jgi:hypothetical protein